MPYVAGITLPYPSAPKEQSTTMSRASENIHPMPPFPQPPAAAERSGAFTAQGRIAWTTGVKFRAGRIAIGGSPWQLTVLPEWVRPFARRLYESARAGLLVSTPDEQSAALHLLDRGIADPLPGAADGAVKAVDAEIVVPVHGGPDEFEQCLASVAAEGLPVTVVDDASPQSDASRIKQIATDYGARLIVHEENAGPGAARNTGFAVTTAPFVAFIDSDAIASPNWVSRLRPVFDDPAVGAAGPRVRPDIQGTTPVELYEETRSELDMGPDPSQVVYGVPVGWLPTASAMVRRSAVTEPPFEPGMRVGEDVDLFWRMDEAGWTVRYVTDVVNHHRVRTSLGDFIGRRAMYGSSAAHLEARHPNRLIPAQPSASGLAIIAALSSRRSAVRWSALAVAGYELARQRRLFDEEVPFSVVAEMTALTLWTDAFWAGHLLRRDWWPIGWSVLAAALFSRLARGVSTVMMIEPVRDHLFSPSRLGPAKSLALRMLDDASYGTGVIRNAVRQRVANVVTPRVSFPAWPKETTPTSSH